MCSAHLEVLYVCQLFFELDDADGEYYISKAIFWLCESNCPICQEKVKKAQMQQQQRRKTEKEW